MTLKVEIVNIFSLYLVKRTYHLWPLPRKYPVTFVLLLTQINNETLMSNAQIY